MSQRTIAGQAIPAGRTIGQYHSVGEDHVALIWSLLDEEGNLLDPHKPSEQSQVLTHVDELFQQAVESSKEISEVHEMR